MTIVIAAKQIHVVKGKRPVFLTKEQYAQRQRERAWAARYRSLESRVLGDQQSSRPSSLGLPTYEEQESGSILSIEPPCYKEHEPENLPTLLVPSIEPPAYEKEERKEGLGEGLHEPEKDEKGMLQSSTYRRDEVYMRKDLSKLTLYT